MEGITSSEKRWLTIILVLAAAVRVYGLTSFSLSNDELSALARLQFGSFGEMIREGVYPDFHPAGVQVFLYFWTQIFGTGEWVVRIPFALFGFGSVFLLYRIGRQWFGPAAALGAAAALATLEFPLLYSQIARPYSPGLFFTLLATFMWTRFFFDEASTKKGILLNAAGFAAAVVACMYIHYFSFIFAGILCVAGLFFVDKMRLPFYMGSGLLIVSAYIPHFNILFHQLAKGGVGGAEGWLGPPDSSTFGKYILYGFNDSETLKYIFIVICLGSVLAFKGRFKKNRFHLMCVILFLLPYLIAYYYSIYRNPVLQYSVLLFSFPYLILLAFSFVPGDVDRFTRSFLTVIVLISCSWSSFAVNGYYGKQHFTEFRGIAERIKQLDEAFGTGNISRAINIHAPFYINYYLTRMGHDVPFGVYRVNSDEEVNAFAGFIDRSASPYFLFAYSNMYDDPKLDMMIRFRYPYLIARDSMMNSGLRLYSATPSDSVLNAPPYFSMVYGFETGQWWSESECRDSATVFSGKYSVKLDPAREWGPIYSVKLLEKQILPGSRIEASAVFLTPSLPLAAKFVVSIDRDGKSIVWQGAEIGKSVSMTGKWTRVYITADVPLELTGTEELKLYCWNEKKETVLMDDVRLSVYGSRP